MLLMHETLTAAKKKSQIYEVKNLISHKLQSRTERQLINCNLIT